VTKIGRVPSLLFADGPGFAEAIVAAWQLDDDDVAESTTKLVADLVPAWATETGASQVAIAVPFGGDRPGVTFVCVDETDYLIEEAQLDIEGRSLKPARTVEAALFPVATWQELLARNAGYDEFAKWRCQHCLSVCPGEATHVPSPCDFCGSTDIALVPRATRLRPPRLAYRDEEAAAADALVSTFVDTVLTIVEDVRG
jgi:hypothetical protein